MDQRQTITANKLEAKLEAELRAHGCDNEVKVVAVGEAGDWTAGVGGKMTKECTDAYIVLLSRLKRDYFLDYAD